MTSPDEGTDKGVAVCEDCEDVVSVWIEPDGTIRPISPQQTCSCGDTSLRLVRENDLFSDGPEPDP